MMLKRKKNEGGFTLIELIMVIVILGIISAVAVPKFLSLAGSARLSSARGVGSAISGTISAEHADYLMTGSTAAYLINDVLSGTAFSGGINFQTGVGATAAAGDIRELTAEASIELNLASELYQWTYTALDLTTGTPAFLTEITGGNGF